MRSRAPTRRKRANRLKEEAGYHEQSATPSSQRKKKKEAKGFKKIRPDCQAVDLDLGDYTQWVRLRAPTRKKEPTD